ncbi:hypothetical protein chiPu_0014339 [Chiloscyllium punctatum]|uniref:Uncharacterized protein n=1 Tax=Chiloscyllium punctatum TaxID=137246 RepID=A0A401SZP7_CHIPU|nr:hypothetical protein [Chiloscyllium punctatum]
MAVVSGVYGAIVARDAGESGPGAGRRALLPSHGRPDSINNPPLEAYLQSQKAQEHHKERNQSTPQLMSPQQHDWRTCNQQVVVRRTDVSQSSDGKDTDLSALIHYADRIE